MSRARPSGPRRSTGVVAVAMVVGLATLLASFAFGRVDDGEVSASSATPAVDTSADDGIDGGRGVDDVDAVQPAAQLVSAQQTVPASSAGASCLTGDSDPADGCVVAQLRPQLVAPGACAGLSGEFLVHVGGVNPANLVSFTIPTTVSGGTVPAAIFADGQSGQSYQWAYRPTDENGACFDEAAPVWRTFRIDMVRSGVEQMDEYGPFATGLSSGALTTRINSTTVQLVGGATSLGLSYRSPGGVGHEMVEPTGTLPVGWSLDGFDDVPPWVTVSQVGSGSIPAAVVLTGFDGQQVEFTNTLAGTSSTSGAWAPPTQSGLPSGQFGTLTGSGDLSAEGSTFTWSSGQQVVIFTRSSDGVWGISDSHRVQPGGAPSATLDPQWDSSGSRPRLVSLTDPVSGRSASFRYASGDTCAGVAPPTEGSDVYHAPSGLLCGWTNFDGSSIDVWYSLVADGEYQVGRVHGSGGSITQLSWATDGGLSAPQLVGVQRPDGHDAQNVVSTLHESDTTWTANYDVFGNVESVVTPRPGISGFVAGADDDRRGRVYGYNSDSNGNRWATVSHAMLADHDEPTEVASGASIIAESLYDAAWRTSTAAKQTASGGFWVVRTTWDAVRDRMLARQNQHGLTTASEFDHLGRVTDQWGPAPAGLFAVTGDGTGVAPTGDVGSISHTVKSYDADPDNKLTGWGVSLYSGSVLAGVPVSTLGSCSDGQCPGSAPAPLDWSELPPEANVSGGDWSMQLTASRRAPADSGTDGQLRYRVSTDGNGTATLWADGVCTVPSETVSECAAGNTAAAPVSVGTGDPVTLSVEYSRDGTAVSSSAPVTVRVEESIDGGSTWSVLDATLLDPGFGLMTSSTQSDTLSTDGGPSALTMTATFADPEFQQIATQTSGGGSFSVTGAMDYEAYTGDGDWGRAITQTRPGGNAVSADYWNDSETASNPCNGSLSANQSGLQSTFTTTGADSPTATGDVYANTYDSAGRVWALRHTAADGSRSRVLCQEYDERGSVTEVTTGSGALTGTISYPWNDPGASNPFRAAIDWDAAGVTVGDTATVSVDLHGRAVQSVDVWGTTTTTIDRLDPSTGIQTVTETITTDSGYTQTWTTTINIDGTVASRTLDAGATVLRADWTYTDTGLVDTIRLSDTGGEIVTETRSYDATTAALRSTTWTRGGTAIGSNTVTFAPNSLRVLSNELAAPGASYVWEYGYNELSWLVSATLGSSDGSLTADIDYVFEEDANAVAGENADAYLNGNVTTKSTSIDGGAPVVVDYHYDHSDRLTRTTDPDIGGDLVYDAFGNMTTVGANTIVYDDRNTPIEVSDGTSTVSYTRLVNGDIVEKRTTTPDGTVTQRYSSRGLILDENNTPTIQVVEIGPVIATVPIAGGEASYQLDTLRRNRFIVLDGTGSPVGEPTVFDPYGNQLQPERPTTPSTNGPDFGWHATSQAETETLELPYVMMGHRVYVPTLGLFSSQDPRPGGALSAYNYANSDPINYHDPDGRTAKWIRDIGHFFNKDIPAAWDWSFSSGEPWWHAVVGVVVIVVIVVVVVLIIVAVTYATGGADLDVGGIEAAEEADAAGAFVEDGQAAAIEAGPEAEGGLGNLEVQEPVGDFAGENYFNEGEELPEDEAQAQMLQNAARLQDLMDGDPFLAMLIGDF